MKRLRKSRSQERNTVVPGNPEAARACGDHVSQNASHLDVALARHSGRWAFLAIALRHAQQSRCRYRVGAVLVKGGRVLAHACNRYRNSPGIDFHHATFHAEEVLLRRARCPRGAVVYVARVSATGAPRMARPCPRCQGVLATGGVIRAHYTTPAGPGALRLN
ncbi:hypothetical protein [Streptomyces noursei]|uniref:hypothetical protein n=1 Tax=Streptomyces noursei TaxID=1971 RepID=UPI0035E3EDBE